MRCGVAPRLPSPISLNDLATSMSSVTVSLADAEIAVHLNGPSEARCTLLCVHGWTLDHRAFDRQLTLADAGVRLATFDRRGFGRSGLEPDLEREVDDLARIATALPGPVLAYGVSQGARLLLRLAATAPNAVAGILVQGGVVDGLSVDAEEVPFEHFADLLRQGQMARFLEEWLAHPLMSGGVSSADASLIRQLVEQYSGVDLIRGACRPVASDLRTALGALSLPLAVIDADLEVASRKVHSQFLIEECGAVSIPVPGGHLCNVTHAEEFNNQILRWIDSLTH